MKSVIEYVLDFTLLTGQVLRFSHKDRACAIRGARAFLKTLSPRRKLSLTFFSRAWYYETTVAKISGKRQTRYVSNWRSPSMTLDRMTVKSLLWELDKLEVMP